MACLAIPESFTTTATTVKTKEFTRELEWIERFIERKATIPILQNVAIIAAGGNIRLMGTDLEIGATSDLAASDDSFFSITVPAKQALKYLKKVSDTDVSLSVEDNKLVIRHGEDSEVTLYGMSMESYPELPAHVRTMELSGLLQAIPRILPAISAEASRFTLNGALLEVRDGARLVSTDGHRLSLHEIQASDPVPVRCLLQRCVLAELAHMKVDAVGFGMDTDHVFFDMGSRKIMARKLSGSFPDWERVMPKQQHCATVDGKGLAKVIDRVMLFADERSKALLLTLTLDKLTMTASTCEGGSAKGSVPAAWNGEEFSVGLNGEYLMDFLRLTPPAVAFDLKFQDHTKGQPHAITMEVPRWTYLVMPMRV